MSQVARSMNILKSFCIYGKKVMTESSFAEHFCHLIENIFYLYQGQIKHLQVREISEEDCNFLPYNFSFLHGHVTRIIHLKIVANKYFLKMQMKIKKALNFSKRKSF